MDRGRHPGRALRLTSLLLLCLLGTAPAGRGLDISVLGNWSRSVGVADLSGGAGSDLTSSIESASDQSAITISGTAGAGDSWRVDVKKSDSVWSGSLQLDVRRSSDGSGSGGISGGTSYLEITGTDQSFFSGDDDRSDVDLQLKLSGVSVSLGAGSFQTTVTYTVIDT